MGFFIFVTMNNLFALFEECNSVCTDTRKMEPHCLFVCLSGDNFNGNTFAKQAIQQGPKYVIVDDPKEADDKSIFLVRNTLDFLQKLANHHRNKFDIPVIGITGSNGKTSTKELIHTVLSQKYNTVATIGNLNNHIGVPLTLLRMKASDEVAIIEMGANKFKDIEELCQIAEPNYGIITNIGKAHLEGFGSFEGVLKTKSELYHAVADKKGTIFYNEDDPILKNQLPGQIQSLSYGSDESADIQGELLGLTPFVNMKWKFDSISSDAILTQMIGKYNYYNFLAAICIGTHFKVPSQDISQAISSYVPSNNRSQLHKTKDNELILDAYNANPTSMASAIESFYMMDHPKKIAILGDMLELGTESEQEHKQIIELIKSKKLTCFFVGPNFNKIKQADSAKLHFSETKEDFIQQADKQAIKNSLILLKGSRGIGLEDLIEKL